MSEASNYSIRRTVLIFNNLKKIQTHETLIEGFNKKSNCSTIRIWLNLIHLTKKYQCEIINLSKNILPTVL